MSNFDFNAVIIVSISTVVYTTDKISDSRKGYVNISILKTLSFFSAFPKVYSAPEMTLVGHPESRGQFIIRLPLR